MKMYILLILLLLLSGCMQTSHIAVKSDHQHCSTSDDCAIIISDCSRCSYPGVPVNKNFTKIYNSLYEETCKEYTGSICDNQNDDYTLECKKNICTVSLS